MDSCTGLIAKMFHDLLVGISHLMQPESFFAIFLRPSHDGSATIWFVHVHWLLELCLQYITVPYILLMELYTVGNGCIDKQNSVAILSL